MNSKLILKNLKLQNFATFSNQQIKFNNGFNAIVGETGSGKSLILDALQMIFGARADKKLVRKEAEFATIEASFSVNDQSVNTFFDNLGFPLEEDVVIKRIVYSNGKTKSYLNFQTCPLNILNLVSNKFIDLVGQFENQKLLSDDYQLRLLDDYSNNGELYKSFTTEYNNLKLLEAKLIDLQEIKSRSLERKDFLQFQIGELEKFDGSNEEEIDLKKKKDSILNFEKNQKSFSEINHLLSESDSSIISQLSRISKVVDMIDIDVTILERLTSTIAEVEDLSYEFSKMADSDIPEESVDDIISRLDQYQKIKRKFNCDTFGLQDILKKYKCEYNEIEVVDSEINALHKKILKQSQICQDISVKLHENRVKFAKKLSSELTSKIQALNMKGAIIDIRISKLDAFNNFGISKLNFFAQTNPGEGYYPIKDIASGGELSRILLALRQILSLTGSISVFLFDEIDTGVGGETAITIGKALRDVSQGSQVISITHLPQIANYADQLLWVEKESKTIKGETRTESNVMAITKDLMPKYIKEMQAL